MMNGTSCKQVHGGMLLMVVYTTQEGAGTDSAECFDGGCSSLGLSLSFKDAVLADFQVCFVVFFIIIFAYSVMMDRPLVIKRSISTHIPPFYHHIKCCVVTMHITVINVYQNIAALCRGMKITLSCILIKCVNTLLKPCYFILNVICLHYMSL